MPDTTDQARIEQTADEILDTLETPINGVPSINIVRRGNAKRLLVAALTVIWESTKGE